MTFRVINSKIIKRILEMQIDKNCDRKLSEFISGDDPDFYEEHTIHLTDEEQ